MALIDNPIATEAPINNGNIARAQAVMRGIVTERTDVEETGAADLDAERTGTRVKNRLGKIKAEGRRGTVGFGIVGLSAMGAEFNGEND